MRGIGRLVRITISVALVAGLMPGFAMAAPVNGVASEYPGVPGTTLIPAPENTTAGPRPEKPQGYPTRDAIPLTGSKDAPAGGTYAEAQIIVKYKTGVSSMSAARANARIGASTVKRFRSMPGVEAVRLTSGLTVEQAIERFEAMPEVAYAEPNFRVSVAAIDPDDPRYPDQWHLKNTGQDGGTVDADVDADLAWSYETGSASTRIGVIDTGVDYTHPDLDGNVWVNAAEQSGTPGADDDGNGYIDDIYGWDAVDDDGDAMDGHGHGTHVAGILGAEGNNADGVSGVSWDVSIVPIRVLDSYGSGTMVDVLEGFDYADALGIPVLNNSWGRSGGFSQAEYDAMAAMTETLFVCAAGNAGADTDTTPFYPASYDLANVLAVGASDSADAASWFSNYGATSVDVFAPGSGINATIPAQQQITAPGVIELYRDEFDTLDDWVPFSENTRFPGMAVSSAFSWSPTTSAVWGAYGNNEEIWLDKATPLDLSAATNPWMHWRMGYKTEEACDFVWWGVYDASDDTYYPLGSASGYNQDWQSFDFVEDLTAFVGENDIYPYFGLATDGSISPLDPVMPVPEFWGMWIDDVTVVEPFMFADGFDSSAGWSSQVWGAGSSWVWDSGVGHSAPGCWRISPVVDWVNSVLYQIDPVDLSDAAITGATLDFWADYSLESGYDYLRVLVSTDNWSSSTQLAAWSGGSGGWSSRTLSLDPYVGNANVEIAFQLTSDSSVWSTGAWIDDVSVRAQGLSDYWTEDTTHDYSYQAWNGTSMAAPVASGAAALLLSRYPAISTTNLKAAILTSAEPVTGLADKCSTGARLNVWNAFTALNAAPAVSDDTAVCDEDASATGNVLGNDTDAESDAMTAEVVSGVSAGSLSLGADGAFTYTPDADWNGSVSFTYKATDGIGESVGSATITVNAVNDVPVTSDDHANCSEDDSVTINVLGNDTDVDLDALTTALASGPVNGAVLHNADGSFTYTPNPDWYGTDAFSYVANDGTVDSASAVVTIDVANTAGVADDLFNVQTNGTRVASAPGVLANENYLADSLSAVLLSGPTHGTLSFNADGSFIYIPEADYVGLDSFTYKATDGTIETGAATVTLQVSPFGPPVDNVPGVVYRFYNLKSHAHFYTLSLEERDAVLKKHQGTLSYEGPAFWSFPAAGTIPVFRFYNPYSGSHFYTANEQEKARVQALWPYLFTYEGTAFHIYTAPGDGRSPVYRFYNPETGCHFYTVSEQERAYVKATWPKTWNEEGVGFWVMNGTAMP